MEAKDIIKPEEQDKRPDYLNTPAETENFGGGVNNPEVKESHPELGNQSQTGAVTNSNNLDIEPEPRDTGGIVGPTD